MSGFRVEEEVVTSAEAYARLAVDSEGEILEEAAEVIM